MHRIIINQSWKKVNQIEQKESHNTFKTNYLKEEILAEIKFFGRAKKFKFGGNVGNFN